jgi:hypothetical protein
MTDIKSRGSAIDVYNRLSGEKDMVKETWDAVCVRCSSSNLSFHPTEISFRPHNVHDFSDLPESVRPYFSKLPTIIDCILFAAGNEKGVGICVECLDCKDHVQGFYNKRNGSVISSVPNVQNLKKYIVKFYGYEEVLVL